MDDERRAPRAGSRFEEGQNLPLGIAVGHDDPVLAALQKAPVVAMTEQERALMDELGGEPIPTSR